MKDAFKTITKQAIYYVVLIIVKLCDVNQGRIHNKSPKRIFLYLFRLRSFQLIIRSVQLKQRAYAVFN